jgi:hypothetical protein
MTFFADEVVSIASGETKTLTSTKYDNAGGAKAIRVVLTAHTAPLAYRYGTDAPDTTTHEYHPLLAGDSITVDGYDNIKNLQFTLASGVTTAQLFASYAA